MHSQQDFAERNEKNALPRRIISVSTKERAFADDTKNTKMATNQMQDDDVLDTLLHAAPASGLPLPPTALVPTDMDPFAELGLEPLVDLGDEASSQVCACRASARPSRGKMSEANMCAI
jgi:hypothetical protein